MKRNASNDVNKDSPIALVGQSSDLIPRVLKAEQDYKIPMQGYFFTDTQHFKNQGHFTSASPSGDTAVGKE